MKQTLAEYLRNHKQSHLLSHWFLAGLFFDPEDESDVLPKRRLTFNGLHGVIFQKMVLFITTAVTTSNPTEDIFICSEKLHT
jgi:hypothetical protein